MRPGHVARDRGVSVAIGDHGRDLVVLRDLEPVVNLASNRLRHGLREVALTLGALIGGLCLLLALAVLIFDVRVLSFRSGSMSPTMTTGTLALARTVPAGDLADRDVVSVLTSSGSRVTHRIVGIEHQGPEAVLELRGDANRVADAQPYVVAEADRVFFAVPYLGYTGSLISSPPGIFFLGLYAAFLIRILVGRHRKPAGRGGPGTHRVASRKRGRPGARTERGVGAVVLLVLSTGVLAHRSSDTLAAWTDAVGVRPVTVGTAAVPAPATFTCGGLGAFSVTFSWAAVPGATSYTLHYGAGGSSTRTVTGTSSVVVTLISGGTAWVNANKDYGSTTWTSVNSNTRSYAVALVSLCG